MSSLKFLIITLFFVTSQSNFSQVFGSEEGIIKLIDRYKDDNILANDKNIDTCISISYADLCLQKIGRKISYQYIEEEELDCSFVFNGKKGVLKVYNHELKFIYNSKKKYFNIIFSGGCKFSVRFNHFSNDYDITNCRPCEKGSLSKKQMNSMIKSIVTYGFLM